MTQAAVTTPRPDLAKAKSTCDTIIAKYGRYKGLRFIGIHDSFGMVLYGRPRENLVSMEGEGDEESHILDATAATTVTLWERSSYLLGRQDALIMMFEKIVDLIVPRHDDGYYFLACFDPGTPLSDVEQVRLSISEAFRQ
jgi:hypothetical protein